MNIAMRQTSGINLLRLRSVQAARCASTDLDIQIDRWLGSNSNGDASFTAERKLSQAEAALLNFDRLRDAVASSLSSLKQIEQLKKELAQKESEVEQLKSQISTPTASRLLGGAPIHDAESISHLAFGFMASKALFAALHIGIFTILSNTSMTIEELSRAMPEGVTKRKLTTLVTCLTSIGLLQVDSESKISNVDASEAFLVRGAKYEFGDYLRLQIDQQMYPFMQHLSPVIEGKKSAQRFMDYSEWFADPEEAELYSESQHTGSIGPARTLLKLADFSSSRSLLDVGGGSGAFAITLCQKHAHLQARVLDFPAVCEVGRRKVEEAGMGAQVDFIEGNCLEAEWPEGQDVILMSYLSSSVSGDALVDLYRRAFECLNPGGQLIVHDFMVDDTRDGPPLAALWALQHMIFTPGGISITPSAMNSMMEQAGFPCIEIQTMIPGMTRVAFAKKDL